MSSVSAMTTSMAFAGIAAVIPSVTAMLRSRVCGFRICPSSTDELSIGWFVWCGHS